MRPSDAILEIVENVDVALKEFRFAVESRLSAEHPSGDIENPVPVNLTPRIYRDKEHFAEVEFAYSDAESKFVDSMNEAVRGLAMLGTRYGLDVFVPSESQCSTEVFSMEAANGFMDWARAVQFAANKFKIEVRKQGIFDDRIRISKRVELRKDNSKWLLFVDGVEDYFGSATKSLKLEAMQLLVFLRSGEIMDYDFILEKAFPGVAFRGDEFYKKCIQPLKKLVVVKGKKTNPDSCQINPEYLD